MFETDLDRYESALAPRVGAAAAHDARREMALHLEADRAAQIELGASEAEARAGALAALGDLARAARAETPRGGGFRAEPVLLLAPVLLVLEWFLPQIFPFATHRLFALAAAVAVLVAVMLGRRPRHPWFWGLGGGGLALLTSLALAMADTWRETGRFALGHLSHGTWWDAWMCVPLFGLPPLLLYRLACEIADRSHAAFGARWVRRA